MVVRPTAEIGKEQAVDQFGLAARELANEGERNVVRAQQAQGALQSSVHRFAGQAVVSQPAAIAGDLADEITLPANVGVHLPVESFHVHPCRVGNGVARAVAILFAGPCARC